MVDPVVTTGTVSAEEHERLRRSHAALQDQFDAANEVLAAVGRSAGDPDAVLTTIVESARRLCRSDAAHLYLLDDGVYQLIKSVGLSEESIAYIAEHPMPIDRDTLIGRVGLDRRTQQIAGRAGRPRVRPARPPAGRRLPHHDGRADDPRRRGRRRPRRSGATRSARSTSARWPSSPRSPARPRWRSTASSSCRSSRPRSAELARKVDELEALREVGEAVSSSLDVDRRALHHRHARRRALRDRRRLDHGVLRAATAASWSAASTGPTPTVVERLRSIRDRPRRDAGRPRRPGAPSDRGPRPRRGRPRPAPADPPRRRLAVPGRRADAPRGPDRRVA